MNVFFVTIVIVSVFLLLILFYFHSFFLTTLATFNWSLTPPPLKRSFTQAINRSCLLPQCQISLLSLWISSCNTRGARQREGWGGEGIKITQHIWVQPVQAILC